MIKLILTCCGIAFSITSAIISFVPESLYLKIKVGMAEIDYISKIQDGNFILMSRLFIFIAVLIICTIFGSIIRTFWWRRRFKGKSYTIIVKYGNLFKQKKCKKIISFDECFTTKVGESPSDIKPDSICGQYLLANPNLNIKKLITDCGLKSLDKKSEFQKQDVYKSGSIVPNGDYLLMAFAKLNQDGLGEMSYEEYLMCLDNLWKNIDKNYGSKSVCLPILGSGRTRFDGIQPSQQELLDIMIESYKLSRTKIKLPYKLYIICRKSENFTLNQIGQTL